MGTAIPKTSLSNGVVTLRPLEMSDVADVTLACQDREIFRWTAVIPSPYTEEDAKGWIATHEQQRSEGEAAPFAIVDAVDGRLLGTMGLNTIDWEERHAMVGYWVASWARGHGVATSALQLLVGWAFGGLGLSTIELTVLIGNSASERVAQKSGFSLVRVVDNYQHPRVDGSSFRVTLWRIENSDGGSVS